MGSTWFRDLPLQRKLAFVMLGVCGLVLLLSGTLSAVLHVVDARKALVDEMTVRARVLGQATRAALAFRDEVEAAAQLRTLEADPHVLSARLFGEEGELLAEHRAPGHIRGVEIEPEADGARFSKGELVVVQPVLLDARRIGTLELVCDPARVYGDLWTFGALMLLVLIGSLGAAAALSARLQRSISGPILGLARTAREIGGRRDFSVRVPAGGADEVGLLADSFNAMLGGIEERERALRAANQALADENAERRRADDRVRSQLARLELLHAITRAIGERQDLRSIFQVVVASVESHLPLDFACVCRYDAVVGRLVPAEASAASRPIAERLLGVEGERAAGDGWVDRGLRGDLSYEPDTTGSTSALGRSAAAAGVLSLALVPLRVENRVLAVLLAGRRAAQALDSGECQFLRQLAEHAALAAHQASLTEALQGAYDDLRQSQQAALQQERLRALGQMASGVAHDINNAIAPISIYTGLLLEREAGISREGRSSLETIVRAIGDVAETVARMREFSRVRAVEVATAPVDLNALVRQSVELTRARWSDMPQELGTVVRVRTELDEGLPRVPGVESELRDVLTNLIFNAVDALPGGGTVTLRTQAPAPVEGGVATARIEVVDDGLGMDAATRERCLEPFFTTKGERGTGLGLAMVYGALQRHHAELEIDSEPGRGTTVRMTFPAAVETAGAALTAATEAAPPRDLRILVVDDDPLVLGAVTTAFERDGHTVVAVGGGREGIEAFEASLRDGARFSIVISDLGMPHVDGRLVAAAVKESAPATPVILMTGWGERTAEEMPAHVDRVLGKPARLAELRRAVAELVGRAPG